MDSNGAGTDVMPSVKALAMEVEEACESAEASWASADDPTAGADDDAADDGADAAAEGEGAAEEERAEVPAVAERRKS